MGYKLKDEEFRKKWVNRDITVEHYGTIGQAIKDIEKGPSQKMQCPICWLHSKEEWGVIKRYENEEKKTGLHYFCKEHAHHEMPKFCPYCKRPLIEKEGSEFCRNCNQFIELSRTWTNHEKIKLKARILNELKSGSLTRSELVARLKVKRTTVYDYLNALEKQGFVTFETRKLPKGPGRPRTFWILTDKIERLRKKISRRKKEQASTKLKKVSRTSEELPSTKIRCPNNGEPEPYCECYLEHENKCSFFEASRGEDGSDGMTLCGRNPPNLLNSFENNQNETLSGISLESSKSTKKMEHD